MSYGFSWSLQQIFKERSERKHILNARNIRRYTKLQIFTIKNYYEYELYSKEEQAVENGKYFGTIFNNLNNEALPLKNILELRHVSEI